VIFAQRWKGFEVCALPPRFDIAGAFLTGKSDAAKAIRPRRPVRSDGGHRVLSRRGRANPARCRVNARRCAGACRIVESIEQEFRRPARRQPAMAGSTNIGGDVVLGRHRPTSRDGGDRECPHLWHLHHARRPPHEGAEYGDGAGRAGGGPRPAKGVCAGEGCVGPLLRADARPPIHSGGLIIVIVLTQNPVRLAFLIDQLSGVRACSGSTELRYVLGRLRRFH